MKNDASGHTRRLAGAELFLVDFGYMQYSCTRDLNMTIGMQARRVLGVDTQRDACVLHSHSNADTTVWVI